MVRVSNRKSMSWRSVSAVALLALAALLAACAAPTGAGPAQSSGAQAAAQVAAATAPAAAQAGSAAQTPAATGSVSYSKDVVPVFEASCIKCHGGPDGTKGDLSLKTYDELMKGGEHGAAIMPGDANGSLLVKQIQSGKMPKRSPKLPQDQIDLIAKWVAEGANNN